MSGIFIHLLCSLCMLNEKASRSRRRDRHFASRANIHRAKYSVCMSIYCQISRKDFCMTPYISCAYRPQN